MDKAIIRKLSYGVYVVTTWADGKPTGCVVNSIMQITSSPATFALSVNHDNYTNECIKTRGRFAINVLPEDIKPSTIGTFGFKSGRAVDKFASVPYSIKDKLPVLDECCGFISCTVIDTMETETHTVFLGRLDDARSFGDKTPMTYDYYHRVIKGSAPKAAPTYDGDEKSAKPAPTKKFKCKVCGYVYEGEALPDDYVCPICGVGPDMFEEIE